jgi:hypothetical protein
LKDPMHRELLLDIVRSGGFGVWKKLKNSIRQPRDISESLEKAKAIPEGEVDRGRTPKVHRKSMRR